MVWEGRAEENVRSASDSNTELHFVEHFVSQKKRTNVTVASLYGVSDSRGGLLLGHLPGAKAQFGNLGTIGQGEVGRPSDGRGVHDRN